MKSSRIGFFVLFISMLIVSCKPKAEQGVEPILAMPIKPIMVIESKDAHAFFDKLTQSNWIQELNNKPEWEKLKLDFEFFKKVLPQDSLDFFLKKRKLWIGYSLSGADRYDFIFAAPIQRESFEQLSRKSSSFFQIEKRIYEGVEIISLSSEDSKQELYAAFNQGVILLSPALTLVEEAIRTVKSGKSLLNDLNFVKVRKTANAKDMANVYLNPSEFYLYSKAKLRIHDQVWIENLGDWVALDLQMKNGNPMLTGLMAVPDSAGNYLTCFRNNNTVSTDASSLIIPTGIAVWMHHGAGNFGAYYRKYEEYIEWSGKKRSRDLALEALPPKWEETLKNGIHKEWGVYWMALPNLLINNKIAYLRWSDIKNAENDLLPYSDENFIEAHRELQIRRLAQPGMLQPILGKAFNQVQQPYYAFYAHYVLMADHLEILKQVLNDLIDGRVLSELEDYRKLESSLPDKYSLQIVCRQPESLPQAAQILPLKWGQMLNKYTGLHKHGKNLVVQINATNDMAFTGIYVSGEAKSQARMTRPLWTFSPEAKVIMGPQTVKNHLTQLDEILIQDENHTLYLIGSDGTLQWKRKFDAPIKSPVQQVDLYQNNRLQLIFACGNKVFVLDRNGKDVAPWPFVAPEPITTAIGVFDYDRIRNYRFLFSSGNKLHNIDGKAQEVKGWKLSKIDAPLAFIPKHKVLGGKDYLLFQTLNGKAYVTDRTGAFRNSSQYALPLSQSEFYLDETQGNQQPFLTALSESAVMYNLFLNGKSDSLALMKLKTYSLVHYQAPTTTLTHESRIFVKDPKQPFEKKLDHPVTEPVIPYPLQGKNYYPVVFGAQELVGVLNSQGEMIKGMPVYGSERAILGKLSKQGLNLICITPEGAVINYLFGE